LPGQNELVALEAEQALLGGLLNDPTQVSTIAEMLTGDQFGKTDHGAVFDLLVRLSATGEPLNLVNVMNEIRREGRAESYGGVAYVMSLPEHALSSANLSHFASIVLEKFILRRLAEFGDRMSRRALSQPEDVPGLLEKAVKDLTTLGKTHSQRSWQPISIVIDAEVERLEGLDNAEGGVSGHRTRFVDLDQKLSGLQPTDLLVLAARPGMGKTALALNIAQNLAVQEGKPVGIFSMEMSRGQIVSRMLSCEASVRADRMRNGTLDNEDWEKLTAAEGKIRTSSIYIDDTASLSIHDVRTRARRLKSEHEDLALIVIDYLQLMKGEDGRAPREQQISSISRGLKGLAKDIECPILALSQLNRGVESRADKRPILSDLRESGAIEQDADVILFIYRDDYYDTDSTESGIAEIKIAKHRGGPTGTIRLAWQDIYTRFDNWLGEDIQL
jgi:replicative DNA helicase